MEELEKKNNEEINNEDLKEESKEVKENNEEKNEVVEGEDEVKEAVEGEIVEEEKKEEVMETIIECYTDYNYKARKTCQMYFLNVKSHFKIYNIVMAIVCLGLGIYSLVVKNYFIAIVGVLALIYLLYSFLTQEKKVDKAIIKFMQNNPSFRMNYYINEEKIRMTQEIDGKEQKGDVPWAYVNEIHYTDEYYFLYLQGATLIIDRNEECITKGSKAELDELIKKICELKPLKYYNKPLNIKLNYNDKESDK